MCNYTCSLPFPQNFQGEAQDCHGLTYQSHQLLEMMEVYVKSTYRDYKNATPEKKVSKEKK